MTPFAIFAFVLTFGYFVYFAVMITLDLHAKPADGQKNEEEDIDVEGMKKLLLKKILKLLNLRNY